MTSHTSSLWQLQTSRLPSSRAGWQSPDHRITRSHMPEQSSLDRHRAVAKLRHKNPNVDSYAVQMLTPTRVKHMKTPFTVASCPHFIHLFPSLFQGLSPGVPPFLRSQATSRRLCRGRSASWTAAPRARGGPSDSEVPGSKGQAVQRMYQWI